MKILTIIPALGKHRYIPRMNARFLLNKPLVSYCIGSAKQVNLITDIYVSTDDEEISNIATIFGAKVMFRPDNLSGLNCGLDEVIIDAWRRIEAKESINYDYIITLQPNSPLINVETIEKAISDMLGGSYDTAISVKDDTGLFWAEDEYKLAVRDFSRRENVEKLNKRYKETGGILISSRFVLEEKHERIGNKVNLVKLPKDEGLEIKDFFDWWIAEKLLNRKRILFRVDGYHTIGLGHIYRTLLLANRLSDHTVLFVSKAEYDLGIRLIMDQGYNLKTFTNEQEYSSIIDHFGPQIIINDILDTDESYISSLKSRGLFVVNFEDMGEGARKADLVINALYNEKFPMPNYYCGKDFYCLREEFYLTEKKEIAKKVSNILVTFGGTDSHNYTLKIVRMMANLPLKEVKITIILGLGYQGMDELNKEIKNLGLTNIEVKQNIKNISKYMFDADIAITSAGRTVYELASIGTPMIVLAQNNRELRHTFASAENGIINLGLGYEVSDEEIAKSLLELVNDFEMRKKCNQLMLQNNLKSGVQNVLKLIFDQYAQFRGEL